MPQHSCGLGTFCRAHGHRAPGEGVQVGEACRHQGVLLACLAAQPRQAGVQRDAVPHAGALAPLHHRPHALRPLVQPARVGEQLGRRRAGPLGGAGVAARRRRRHCCLVCCADGRQQLDGAEEGQVVGGGWAARAADGGHLAAEGGRALVPPPQVGLAGEGPGQAQRVDAGQEGAATLSTACLPAGEHGAAPGSSPASCKTHAHDPSPPSHQRQVLCSTGRRHHLRRRRLQEALQVRGVVNRLGHLAGGSAAGGGDGGARK